MEGLPGASSWLSPPPGRDLPIPWQELMPPILRRDTGISKGLSSPDQTLPDGPHKLSVFSQTVPWPLGLLHMLYVMNHQWRPSQLSFRVLIKDNRGAEDTLTQLTSLLFQNNVLPKTTPFSHQQAGWESCQSNPPQPPFSPDISGSGSSSPASW